MQKNIKSVSDETELIFLRLGGYNWTYLESEDDSEMSAYTISVANGSKR